MVAKGDSAEVVDPHIFANPSVVAYDELPRVLDGDARLEDHAEPHFSTEKAQEGALKGAGPREPSLEEQARNEDPKGTRQPGARAVV